MDGSRSGLREAEPAAALQRDGYAVARGFLSSREIAALADVFRACDSPLHRQPFGASILSRDLAYRAAVDRGIRAVIAPRVDELFEDSRCCFANFLVKQPNASGAGEIQLHQDITFVDESRYQSLGLWCPLVDVDPVNGCMDVLPGSHRGDTPPRTPGTPQPYRGTGRPTTVPVPMRAGDVMIFSQKLFHASPPNRGKAIRVAAGALVVPREAQLYCFYPDAAAPERVEVFAVDDRFYTQYEYGTRPSGVPRVGVIAA